MAQAMHVTPEAALEAIDTIDFESRQDLVKSILLTRLLWIMHQVAGFEITVTSVLGVAVKSCRR